MSLTLLARHLHPQTVIPLNYVCHKWGRHHEHLRMHRFEVHKAVEQVRVGDLLVLFTHVPFPVTAPRVRLHLDEKRFAPIKEVHKDVCLTRAARSWRSEKTPAEQA
jgi:hypothetical protein